VRKGALEFLSTIIKPNPMADDVAGKAVMLVAFGVGGRGHASLPLLRFDWLRRDHRQRDDVIGEEARSPA
jgi:hypothetical protein